MCNASGSRCLYDILLITVISSLFASGVVSEFISDLLNRQKLYVGGQYFKDIFSGLNKKYYIWNSDSKKFTIGGRSILRDNPQPTGESLTSSSATPSNSNPLQVNSALTSSTPRVETTSAVSTVSSLNTIDASSSNSGTTPLRYFRGFSYPVCEKLEGVQRIGDVGSVKYKYQHYLVCTEITVSDPLNQLARGWSDTETNQPFARNLAQVLLSVRSNGQKTITKPMLNNEPYLIEFCYKYHETFRKPNQAGFKNGKIWPIISDTFIRGLIDSH